MCAVIMLLEHQECGLPGTGTLCWALTRRDCGGSAAPSKEEARMREEIEKAATAVPGGTREKGIPDAEEPVPTSEEAMTTSTS